MLIQRYAQLWFFINGSETSFSTNISHAIFYLLTTSLYLVALLLEIFSNICTVIIWYPLSAAINFEINISFLIKPFSYMITTVWTKTSISQDQKELSMPNRKRFLPLSKGFHLKPTFLKGESMTLNTYLLYSLPYWNLKFNPSLTNFYWYVVAF